METKLLAAHVASDDGILLIDVLQIGTQRWLVPEWFEWRERKEQTPAIAIRLDGLAYQHHGVGAADLTVNVTIPKAVLTGQSQQIAGRTVEVVLGPSDRFGRIPFRRTS